MSVGQDSGRCTVRDNTAGRERLTRDSSLANADVRAQRLALFSLPLSEKNLRKRASDKKCPGALCGFQSAAAGAGAESGIAGYSCERVARMPARFFSALPRCSSSDWIRHARQRKPRSQGALPMRRARCRCFGKDSLCGEFPSWTTGNTREVKTGYLHLSK